MTNKATFNLSSILQISNLAIGLLAILLYVNLGSNEYVDINTIYLTCFFSLQNVLMLAYEKRRPDPFLSILLFFTTFFYLARVLSLLYEPWSVVLLRYSFTSDNLSSALLFILISNIAIFIGLKIAGSKIKYPEIDETKLKPAKLIHVVLIFTASLILNNFLLRGLDSLTWLAGIVGGLLLSIYVILMLTMVYFVVNYRQLSGAKKTIITALLAAFFIVITLIGSRSAILSIFTIGLCSLLAAKGKVTIKLYIIAMGVGLLPVVTASFLVATFLRTLDYDPKTVITYERLELLKEFNLELDEDKIKSTLRPILDRVGYLTYAADIIANGKEYKKIINPEYYIKSIIDNALTPGFNIFDTPRASNALRYIAYGIKDHPTHQDVADLYNSDAFTVYGEYYVLFGEYPALILLAVTAYTFKKVYLKVAARDIFYYYLYRAAILYVFTMWLFSFGLDWMVMDLISLVIPIFIWRKYYKMQRVA